MQNLDSALTGAATVILGAVTLCLALRYASGRKLHPSEPTVVPPWIPFIGHLLGMALHGGRYIKRLGYVMTCPPQVPAAPSLCMKRSG